METLLSLAAYLGFLVPVVIANLGEKRAWARSLTYALLIAINVGIAGLAGLAFLNQLAVTLLPDQVPPEAMNVNWWAAGLLGLATAILSSLPLLPGVRRWLSRWLPIDPASVVHMTALAFAVYDIGASLVQAVLIGNLENLTQADVALSAWDVLLTGLPLALFGLFGVGLFVRRGARDVLARLGLTRPTWRQLLAATGILVVLMGFALGVNLLWEQADPESFQLLERVTENLFGGLTGVGGAMLIGLSAGISEELLFRGAVQPRLGLVPATLLFTLGHVQYGLTFATLQILVIGAVLGLVRNRTNTTVCVLIHAGYNILNVLLG